MSYLKVHMPPYFTKRLKNLNSLNAWLSLALLLLLSPATLPLDDFALPILANLLCLQCAKSLFKCLCVTDYLQLQLVPSGNLTACTLLYFLHSTHRSYLFIMFSYQSPHPTEPSAPGLWLSFIAILPIIWASYIMKYSACHKCNFNHTEKSKQNSWH